MAKLRSVSTAFWSDPFIEDLTPSEKLLYIYFITNEKTNMLGIYEVSVKKISFETGIPKETVLKALESFETLYKIKRIGNYLVLTNFMKHQNYNPNMKKAAIECYLNLPKEVQISNLVINKSNPSEAFESLSNHYGMVRKVEVESESESKSESEGEIEFKGEDETADFEILIYPTFEDFWNLYDLKKGDKDKIKKKFDDLAQDTKEYIMQYLPNYIKSTPDKQYRKHPETFINNKSWNDEIFFKKNGTEKGNNDEFLKAIYDEYNASQSK